LRALALELNRHPNWIVAIGVRPKTESTFDQQAALAQAFAAVETVRGFGMRDGLAETVGWRAVSNQPGAWPNGFGALLFVQPDAPPSPPAASAPPQAGAPSNPAAPAPPGAGPAGTGRNATPPGGSPGGAAAPGSAGPTAPAPPSSGAPPNTGAPPEP
jgi:hypothetical protein